MTMLCVAIKMFHSPMQIKKLVHSRHGTHKALMPTTPNNVIAKVQFVNYLDNGAHTLCREGGKGRSFAAAFNQAI